MKHIPLFLYIVTLDYVVRYLRDYDEQLDINILYPIIQPCLKLGLLLQKIPNTTHYLLFTSMYTCVTFCFLFRRSRHNI